MIPTLRDGDRILVVRPDRVGDVIISSSVLPALHAAFPRSPLFFAAAPAMASLFHRHPLLQDFIPLPTTGAGPGAFRAWHQWWKQHAPTAALFLHPTPAGYAGAFTARIPLRAGWKLPGWSWTLHHAVPDHRMDGTRHEALCNFSLLAPLGVATPANPRASLSLDPNAEVSATALLTGPFAASPLAVINPTAFSSVARWPAARFAAVALALYRERDWLPVVIGGDSADASVAETVDLLRRENIPVLNLAGKTTLAELGMVLRRAQVLVTRDTGPSHLAAAVGCPVVVIFGRVQPAYYGPIRWQPLGDQVEIVATTAVRQRGENKTAFWERSFAEITPEKVIDAVLRLSPAKNAARANNSGQS